MTRVESSAPGRWQRLGAIGSAGAVVSIASVAVNGLAYLPPLLAARMLPASELGALAALLAIGAIAAVPGLGLQTASAVRWARQHAVPGAGRVALAVAAVTTGGLLLATPALVVTLDLPPAQPLLLALITFPVVGAGFWLGELQGRERFGRLALGLVILATARYGGLVAALAAGLGVTGALVVGAAGAWLAVALLRWLAQPSRAGSAVRSSPPGGDTAPAGRLSAFEVLGAGTATLAMLAVSYADLILARSVLSPDAGGAYAVGSVLTKGALWAPGVVTVLALPRFAQGSRRALPIALGCVGACGAVLVLASAFFGDFAMSLAGGAAYAHLGGFAAGFAAVGALYALVYVLVNAEIAGGARWPAGPLWVALAGIAAAVLLLRPVDLGGVLTISACTAAATTLGMAVVVAARRRWISDEASSRPGPR